MIGRAWEWLRSHTWLVWTALGAAVTVAIQLLLRRRNLVQSAAIDTSGAAQSAGRAEVLEEQGKSARAEVARISAEIRESDEKIAEAAGGPNIEEVSNARERARIATLRGL